MYRKGLTDNNKTPGKDALRWIVWSLYFNGNVYWKGAHTKGSWQDIHAFSIQCH